MAELTLVFDSNAFYALEDVSRDRQHRDARAATQLKEIAIRNGCRLVLHPATQRDIDASGNASLREASTLKKRQWEILGVPDQRSSLAEEAGYEGALSPNDQVDLAMLAALDTGAADILVTQDRRLRSHADQLGYGDRALSIQACIEYLERLFGEAVSYPTVEQRKAYEVSVEDPIFESLRSDYDGFDDWFAKARKQHRDCLVISGSEGPIDALAILKKEEDRPHGLPGKVLKVCTLKVAPHAEGAKRGELLLKFVFAYAARAEFDRIYVEVFEDHVGVVRLLGDFGFKAHDVRSPRGELVMVKSRRPTPEDALLDPLTFHRSFGPPAVIVRDVFVIPVQPRWHDILFPERREQLELLAPAASGNAIRKAYLSNSNSRQVTDGALTLFYRSGDAKAVTVIGVVDRVGRFTDPADVRRFVGARTVYTDGQIAALCARGDVLTILFRQDRLLPEAWTLLDLIGAKVLKGPPQTITRVASEEACTWIKDQLNAPL